MNNETYLVHHGIKGQHWGKRNGPPYPLGADDHSSSEKREGTKGWTIKAKREEKKRSNQNEPNEKRGLSDKQKKALKVAGAAIGVAAVAAIAYYGVKSGKLQRLENVGRSALYGKSSKYDLGPLNKRQELTDKLLTKFESNAGLTHADNAFNVNPDFSDSKLTGILGRDNNCVSCATVSCLNELGVKATAVVNANIDPVSGMIMSSSKRNISELEAAFKGTNAVSVKVDSISRTILNTYKKDGAFGVVGATLKNGEGHAIKWKIVDGKVKFEDYQALHDMASTYERRYGKTLTPELKSKLVDVLDQYDFESQFDLSQKIEFIRLDNATSIDINELNKWARNL